MSDTQHLDDARRMMSYDEELVDFDKTSRSVSERREELIDKMSTFVNVLPLDPASPPRSIEVAMNAFNTLASLLNDQEKSSKSRVDVKAKVKDQETDQNHAAMVTELLSRISTQAPKAPYVPPSDPAIDKAIDERISAAGGIPETVTRVDSMDLSIDPSQVRSLDDEDED